MAEGYGVDLCSGVNLDSESPGALLDYYLQGHEKCSLAICDGICDILSE